MKKILILLFTAFLAGCVGGQQYNYEASSMDIPGKPSEHTTLVLAVEDWRPYVLSGDKEPDFVGLQRGGFGEPWNVTTSSGNAMAEDMSAAIAKALKDDGYKVINIQGKNEVEYLVETAGKNGATRIVVLKVLEWKSDVYMGVTLHSNLHLNVYDADGELLADSSTQSVNKIAGGSWATGDDNSEAVAKEFASKVGSLFNEEEIRKALQ